ncbi:aminotransferase class V-fold PLP-dependent enzyme [Lacticaseibacillus brantae]|uniref:cysteine desulfurase n=1 Tax=Lacticaseibacillus brantae DSM 23927 TaxID=1423727 RepID=A0A0R2B090_9LACO|nr:cysteine desulfurase [Lacticaseibacillus brantae]KRM72926.1 cysteine desulfurase [Lacticaseibacillus brantae DSM 23927]
MAWKSDFPFFAAHPELTYLDSAATAQKPQAVIDRLTAYYVNDNANVHRGLYQLAYATTEKFETVRQQVADFVGVAAHNVVFTRGTTESLNLVATSFGPLVVGDGEIVTTVAEHHSNFIPWQQLAQRTGATFKVIRARENGDVALADVLATITPKTKLVALAHVTNVTGALRDIRTIADAVHAVGGYLVVDGAQAVPHLPVKIADLKADFYAFSGHKVYGPTGIGVLVGRTQLLEQMLPLQFGGEMIDQVSIDESTWAPVPLKFEAGTPNIAGVIGLGAALTYVTSIDWDTRQQQEQQMLLRLRRGLAAIIGVTLYGDDDSVGAVSFNLAGVHPHDLATFLDEQNIAVRAGHHCAQPLMLQLKIPATVRASVGLYTDEADIDRLVAGVEAARRFFNE